MKRRSIGMVNGPMKRQIADQYAQVRVLAQEARKRGIEKDPVVKAQIREREMLLLCSDGVHKFVSDDEIAEVISSGLDNDTALETICDALVRAAKRNGSHDDASALLVLRRPWFTPRWVYGCALAAMALLGWLWWT